MIATPPALFDFRIPSMDAAPLKHEPGYQHAQGARQHLRAPGNGGAAPFLDIISSQDAALIQQHGLVNVAEWRIEQLVADGFPSKAPPLEHRFTPGMYSRTIFMPAGDIVISGLHITRHQYVISKGCCSVYTAEEGFVTLTAPFVGITEPETRRLLVIHEDTIWTTFHPNPGDKWKTPEEVIAAITRPNPNPLLLQKP
jgi:hypothetical protein